MVGAIAFVVSDIVLAYDKFYVRAAFGTRLYLRNYLVLGLYWLGQTLLTFGIFLQWREMDDGAHGARARLIKPKIIQ